MSDTTIRMNNPKVDDGSFATAGQPTEDTKKYVASKEDVRKSPSKKNLIPVRKIVFDGSLDLPSYAGKPIPWNVDNSIKTSKYTCLNFVPLNLFEQFRKMANLYFLIMVILMIIGQVSYCCLNKVSIALQPTFFPLFFVCRVT